MLKSHLFQLFGLAADEALILEVDFHGLPPRLPQVLIASAHAMLLQQTAPGPHMSADRQQVFVCYKACMYMTKRA